jgi:amino acid transporter
MAESRQLTDGSRLIRGLSPLMAIAVVVGGIIGSGIFKKPQVVAADVPQSGMAALVWLLGGVLALLGGLALAEVCVLYPKAGGNYVFLREAYGRWAGFLFGWVEFWIIRGASLAAVATIFTESLHDVLRNSAFQETLHLHLGSEPLGFWAQRWLTVAVILGLAFVNILGVRWGGMLQLAITTIKVGLLLGIAALPFLVALLARPGSAGPRPENLMPFWPSSWDQLDARKLGAALVAVLWAYDGWMNIAPVAEEVRRPSRNIPLAFFGGIGIVIFLYLSANLGYYLVLPQPEMAELKNTTVAAAFCLRLFGPIGGAVASAAVMCSVFGTMNGILLVAPRVLYAMGEDGLAPRQLGEVHANYRTPAMAIGVMGIWAIVLVLAGAALLRCRLPIIPVGGWSFDLNLPQGKPFFDVMTDFAIFGGVVFQTLAVTTIFVFRRRRPEAERPYRCLGYPVVPMLYVAVLSLVLVNMFLEQRTEALVGVGFIAVGAGVYLKVDWRRLKGK